MSSNPRISDAQYQTILRQDFSTFIHRSFCELNGGTPYLHNWHIDVIADRLEQCRRGEIKRLIISLPPRNLKSHCVSVAFPAWLLAKDPRAQIICASYSQDLSDKLSLDCRTLMQSSFYRKVFQTRLSTVRQTISEFLTKQQGSRLATSVGGTLTGRGADYIIIDDPQKPDEAVSEVSRQRAIEWFKNTVSSRLNSKTKGCIIVVMQRLHEEDLAGYLEANEGWTVLRFPAIAEEEETHTLSTLLGAKTVIRRVGEALHPEREPLEVLLRLKAELGEYNFAGQYQQRPSPAGGGMVKLEWFKSYSPTEVPDTFDLVFQSWDTANKASELNDFSVCTTWGKKAEKLFLLDVYRERLEFPELKRRVRALAECYRPKAVVIEDKASGTQLLQELKRESFYAAVRYSSQHDKILRMHHSSSMIENGHVYLPMKAPWLDAYTHELASFPKGRFDDQVDSTSQAFDWIKMKGARLQLGLLEYYKQEAARRATGQHQPRYAVLSGRSVW